MAKITPFNPACRNTSFTALFVGSEATGKHEIAKCLVDMGTAIGLKVHTCKTLPLPEDSPVSSMNVPFIGFVMHMANKDSFQTLVNCIGKVDITYFLGRSAIIVNTSGCTTDDAVPYSNVSNIATQYGVPVLFRNIQGLEERAELGRTLMNMIETALGHFNNITPLLHDVFKTGQSASEPLTPGMTSARSTNVSRATPHSQTVGML